MTKDEKKEFLELIQQGTLHTLRSPEARELIKEGSLEALNSEEGQQSIKKGSLKALESEEGRRVFSDLFVDNFKEVVVPAFENHEERIINLEKHSLAA